MTGSDTVQLKDVNAIGSSFTSTWDTGGTDEIVYDGAAPRSTCAARR